MGKEHDIALSLLLASTALSGVVTFGRDANAVPYSDVAALNLGAAALSSGGLAATTTLDTPGTIAIFGGNVSTGTVTITQDNANGTKSTIAAGSAHTLVANGVTMTGTSAGIVVLGTRTTFQPNGGGTGANKGTLTLSQTGTNVYVGSGATFTPGTSVGTIVTGTTGLTGNAMVTAAGSIAQDASIIQTLATAVAGATITLAGTTVSAPGADFKVTNGTVSTGGSIIYSHNRGYTVIDVTSQLTTALTLEAGNADDYFFVYLQGGIGNGGAIVFASNAVSGGVSPIDDNVLVDVGGTINSINQTTQGNYLVTAGTLSTSVGATIDGGIFLANTTTSAAELLMLSGTLINPNPWNGSIYAQSVEPASIAAFASGVVGLGMLRRRRRRPARG